MLKCTVSLLQSVEFAVSVRNNSKWGASSLESVKKVLAKQFDDNEQLRGYRIRGEAFETNMYNLIDNHDTDVGSIPSEFRDAVFHIRQVGHTKQKWYKVYVKSSQGGVYFHGKSDITTTEPRPIIYDLKTCESFSRSKYLDSIQHWVYMAGEPETSKFVYLVCESGPTAEQGVEPVYYQLEIENNPESAGKIVLQRFEKFLENIKTLGLTREYKEYCES